ncbi:hypothetical protein [Ferruginibacter sp. HRS2-29]|uniref:hypothetical protein n=1 Tax=Ferruginibacter sp. HRS2-29 TaxID=2487334 RepID=UPI0020CF6207|nr:hypothetical protein [Ferruginibacter sp. HRS2-29]MCP9752162.1 hypothetical protein [Ferruginibacter sp. HRS2-29]
MRKFKLIDAWINIVLIIGAVIFSLASHDFDFIYSYFIVGGWQVFSMLTHTLCNWFIEPSEARLRYHYIVLIIAAFALIGALFNTLLFCLMAFLLFAAPFMACYYAYLCYKEYYIKMRRPLSLLR